MIVTHADYPTVFWLERFSVSKEAGHTQDGKRSAFRVRTSHTTRYGWARLSTNVAKTRKSWRSPMVLDNMGAAIESFTTSVEDAAFVKLLLPARERRTSTRGYNFVQFSRTNGFIFDPSPSAPVSRDVEHSANTAHAQETGLGNNPPETGTGFHPEF